MVRVNPERCTGCGVCLDYCPLEAIILLPAGSESRPVARIDPELCVQCWVCVRQNVCAFGAIEAEYPADFFRVFQHVISDPVETTAETGVPGRGTEEAKTNDVTGRYRRGEVGIAIDMGRPGVGCRLRDVEKVAMAIARAGVVLEGPEHTPLAKLMTDLKTGQIETAAKDLRVLSVIIEGRCQETHLPAVLAALREVEKEIETVFTLGLVSRVEPDGSAPLLEMLERLGFERPSRGKVNVGLGRPLFQD